jgi:hypothetical protein
MSRKGARNAGGTSWSGESGGESSSSSSNEGKRCDQGGNNHTGAIVVREVTVTEQVGNRWATKTIKQNQCQRCGRNNV